MTSSDRVQYHTSRETIPDEYRHHYEAIEESRGDIAGPFSVLFNSPELAGRIGHVGAYIRFEGELSDRDRELAILTTAREFNCPFEWAAHVPIAREAGVSESAIDVVADSRSTVDLNDDEAIVIEYGRELLGECAISDDTFQAALERFGESGITEFTSTIGYYAMLACVLNAFEVHPRPDQPQIP